MTDTKTLQKREQNVLALGGTPAVIVEAIEMVGDQSIALKERGPVYAALRNLRLRIDRSLKPVGREIQEAMAAADARQWGPIRLSWKAIDPRYPANDPGNWEDAGVQEQLAEWAADPRYQAPDGTPWVKRIPQHCEIDTAALGAAIAMGDPAARELYDLIRAKGYRTEAGRAATITVDEPRREAAA